MSPLLLFAINFILPFVFIMLMFSLVMRIMAKKGGMGGMGGIGGVGKANAKVYMESRPASPLPMWPVRTRPRNP